MITKEQYVKILSGQQFSFFFFSKRKEEKLIAFLPQFSVCWSVNLDTACVYAIVIFLRCSRQWCNDFFFGGGAEPHLFAEIKISSMKAQPLKFRVRKFNPETNAWDTDHHIYLKINQ